MTEQSVTTGSSNYTRYFENEQEVFPCRCGETHRGDYAAYDYGHHNCFHDAGLLPMDPLRGVEPQVICVECGKVFGIVKPISARLLQNISSL